MKNESVTKATTTEKFLAKIESIKLGYAGYQDAQFGLFVTFSGPDCHVSWQKAFWGNDVECSPHAKWTEKQRHNFRAETMSFICDLLLKAKKRDLTELKGVPVEVTLENQCMKGWRILEEVL